MEEKDNCEFCGLPSIGVCPRCHHWYCPDHVQQSEPFLLCNQCAHEDPGYLSRWGEWVEPGVWAENGDPGAYQTLAARMGIKVSSTRDLWRVIEDTFADPVSGQTFWKQAENFYLRAHNNPQGATVCWLRGKGIFSHNDCLDIVESLSKQKKVEEVLEIFRRYLSLFPDDADVLNARAMLYRRNNRWSDAVEDYNAIIRLYPNHPVAYEGRMVANYSMKVRDYKTLEQDLSTLEHLNAVSLNVLLISGMIHAGQVILFGRKEYAQKAHEELTKAMDQQPQNQYLYQVRGLVNIIADREEDGRQDLMNAVEIMGLDAYYDLLHLF